MLAPFPTLDAGDRARCRAIVASGVGPADPRVHRHADDGGDHRRRRPRPRHPRGGQGRGARLPRGDDGEHARGPARRGRRARSPSSSPSSARSTCTCCRRRRGRALIDAREKAFWVAKANGADDIVDIVVPRASIPEFMATVADARRRAPAVDRRLRPRGRRQRAPRRCSSPTPRSAARCCTTSSTRAWRSAARSRASTASAREEALLPRARGPGQDRAHAPHQGARSTPTASSTPARSRLTRTPDRSEARR